SSFILKEIKHDFLLKKLITMKLLTKPFSSKWLLLAGTSIFIISACQKQIDQPFKHNESTTAVSNERHGHLQQTNTFSSDVAFKWIDMQLRLFRTNATPIG